jgi:hypothetical protein
MHGLRLGRSLPPKIWKREKLEISQLLVRIWDSWKCSDTRKICLKEIKIKIFAKIHHLLYENLLWE